MAGRIHRYFASVCFFLLLVIPVSVSALPVTFVGDSANSTEKLGQFTATLEYIVVDKGVAQLWVTLANTSPDANGGWITGFAFNNPNNFIKEANLSFNPRPGEYLLMGGPGFTDTVSASPFADFDMGAALGGSFEGGGSATAGIFVGTAEKFRFTLKGANVETLTERSFIDEVNADGEFFVVRFRGFENGGSDKVPGDPGEGVPVPRPRKPMAAERPSSRRSSSFTRERFTRIFERGSFNPPTRRT